MVTCGLRVSHIHFFKESLVNKKQRLIAPGGAALVLFMAATALPQTLYDNGGLSTGATLFNGTAAPAGYTWSELQRDPANPTFLNNTLGFGAQGSGQRLADDFTVPNGQQWTITQVI